MTIHIATDHAGFELKEFLKGALAAEGMMVIDHGTEAFDPADDYPDYIRPCAEAVAKEAGSFGVILGGSGAGEAIVANRVAGVRAVTFYGPWDERGRGIVRLAREHNDANVLSLAARFMTQEEALAAVKLFLTTAFSGEERHARRIEKIKQI
ncbi:MAG: RpiB/LacA/LacB family sugar-phosphate isomerase [Candidatus Harrisonbacteria bacterium]|nr:RpiB/LacA/LacB family sugar-phosphate isomerase [Candidatus Harrisonbacteria bacterium]